MHDLEKLELGGGFAKNPAADTRLALVHHSFRTVSVGRGIQRGAFQSNYPALGLLNLAHSIRVDAGHGLVPEPSMKYFDDSDGTSLEELAANVKKWLAGARRRVVAASAYTSTVDNLEEFLAAFDPSSYLLMVGGAHATVAPDMANAHIVIRGEGGAAIRHILTTLFHPGFNPSADLDTAGICYMHRGKTKTAPPATDRSIVQIPPPCFAYDLIADSDGLNHKPNFKRQIGERPQIYICTQSCRARCTFCSTYIVHLTNTARPVSLVEQDLSYIVRELGYDAIEFHDDDLLQHADFFGLLSVLTSLEVPWFCYGRAETIDESVARAMANAGCRRVFLGLESMDQATLDYYNKRTTVEQNRIATESLNGAGIEVIAGFMIGAPAQTVEQILRDLDAFLELPLSGIAASVLTPEPATTEFNRAVKRGGLLEEVASRTEGVLRVRPDVDRFGPNMPSGLPVLSEHVSKEDLNRLIGLIEASFYLRPCIVKRLVESPVAAQNSEAARFIVFVMNAFDEIGTSPTHAPINERIARESIRYASDRHRIAAHLSRWLRIDAAASRRMS